MIYKKKFKINASLNIYNLKSSWKIHLVLYIRRLHQEITNLKELIEYSCFFLNPNQKKNQYLYDFPSEIDKFPKNQDRDDGQYQRRCPHFSGEVLNLFKEVKLKKVHVAI